MRDPPVPSPKDLCQPPLRGHGPDGGIFLRRKKRRILSYTGDMLAASYDPPELYGYVEFEGGGRFLCNFTDCTLEDLKVGTPVAFSFRKKYYDEKRDIRGYFWKAVPQKEVV